MKLITKKWLVITTFFFFFLRNASYLHQNGLSLKDSRHPVYPKESDKNKLQTQCSWSLNITGLNWGGSTQTQNFFQQQILHYTVCTLLSPWLQDCVSRGTEDTYGGVGLTVIYTWISHCSEGQCRLTPTLFTSQLYSSFLILAGHGLFHLSE